MKIIIAFLLTIGFLYQSEVHSQTLDFSIKLIDEQSNNPIPDAHVFLENTSFGAISDISGNVSITIPSAISEDIIISHLSFNTKILNYLSYRNYTEGNFITMVPNNIELSELVITAKKSKKWKKQFNKFKKTFIGADKIAKNCTIINPEVLRFEERNGGLKVTALDLIKIHNPHLGYEVNYLLSNFKLSEDGSSEYLGKAFFIDIVDESSINNITENRNEAYVNSSKYFFKTLIDNNLEEAGFNVEMKKYNNGIFTYLNPFVRADALKGPLPNGNYNLYFDEFLEVYNENTKSISFSSTGVRPGGLESQRFSTSAREKKAISNYEVSQLYKISPFIILNKYGNVLNTKEVKEYGYWATQKVANQLPFDYGNNYTKESNQESLSDNTIASELTNEHKLNLLVSLLYETSEIKLQHLNKLISQWEDGFAPPLIELLRLSPDNKLVEAISYNLNSKYNETQLISYYEWIEWLWKKDLPQEDYYFKFKSELYKHIDPKFEKYFANQKNNTLISLDEVIWGGVRQDGIPPLRNPEMIEANDADYLNDEDVIFGFYINGQAKAYPKRILAWHEFFTDNFGDDKIAGVYCTLCGTVIAYDMTYNETFYDLGTSGFLYKSNKLMYDQSSQSLWSTIDGQPVIGDLVGKGIRLKTYPVVTTNWKDWNKLHPQTKVLSIKTGYSRDYREGVAYKEYFETDELMFPVIALDDRLNNKDEVLVIRSNNYKDDPLAISIKYLKRKKWHTDIIGGQSIVIISDKSGAARVYHSENVKFTDYKKGILKDSTADQWNVNEDFLISESGHKLYRIPSHNIFWFAWYNAHPTTRLVK